MKWLFRTIILILLVFFIGCLIGFFLPAKHIVETHITIDGYSEDIYDALTDLHGYTNWYHGFEDVEPSQIIFSNTTNGLELNAAWRQQSGSSERFGHLEILQIDEDKFVSLQHDEGALSVLLNYVIEANTQNDVTILLVRYETSLGGFPYISRLQAKLTSSQISERLDISLRKFKVIIEAKNN